MARGKMVVTEEEESEGLTVKEAWEYKTFAKFYFFLQIIFIILFGTLVEYGDTAKGLGKNATYNTGDGAQVSNFQYIKFQDVHVMVIFGIGFLYTFLERLTWSGSGYTLLIAVLCAQVHILVNGWLYWNAPTPTCVAIDRGFALKITTDGMHIVTLAEFDAAKVDDEKKLQSLLDGFPPATTFKLADESIYNKDLTVNRVDAAAYSLIRDIGMTVEATPIAEEKRGWVQLNLGNVIEADAGAFAILVSYGAVLGLLSPIQLTMMSLIEIILYAVNAWICEKHLNLVDQGGSILIHVFGAVFGIAVSRAVNRKYMANDAKKISNSESNTFALMGMTFLWVLWPSFNARRLDGWRQSVAIANTRWSIAGSALASLMTSKLLAGLGHFDMFQVQEACLAGGVAMGALCSAKIGAWAALLIGVIAGIFVVLSQRFSLPFMTRRIRIIDTRGVSSLHAVAGLIGAIGSGIFPVFSDWAPYAPHRLTTYPGMNPVINEANCLENPNQTFGAGLSGTQQGGRQFVCILVTIAMALIGGVVTGAIIRLPFWEQPDEDQLFDDEDYWILEGENEKYQRFVQRMLNKFLNKPHAAPADRADFARKLAEQL